MKRKKTGYADQKWLCWLTSTYGNTEIAKILTDSGANLQARNKNGLTPLAYMVIFSQNLELIKLLIEEGANVNVTDCQGRTLLIAAVDKGRTEIAKLLIENNADLIDCFNK